MIYLALKADRLLKLIPENWDIGQRIETVPKQYKLEIVKEKWVKTVKHWGEITTN